MLKSPFKFLDSYTHEDRSIFSGCKVYCYEFQEYALNSISPFQGLSVCCCIALDCVQRWNIVRLQRWKQKKHPAL